MDGTSIDGAMCPNCGASELWPLTGDRAQCRSCLKVTSNIETVIKGVA